MPISSIFGGVIALSEKALDLRMQRQGLIQSNIANLQTPGYQAQELPFAKTMARVMSGQGTLARTHESHIQVDPAAMVLSEESSRQGPVDLDEEMLKLSENNLMYQVTTRIVAKKLDGLRFVIDEGGK